MVVPTFPSATAALRLRPRTFARFIGEPVTAWLNSSWRMPNNSRARASVLRAERVTRRERRRRAPRRLTDTRPGRCIGKPL